MILGRCLGTTIASALSRRAGALSSGTTTVALGLAIFRDNLHVSRLGGGRGGLVVVIGVLGATGTCAVARSTRASTSL